MVACIDFFEMLEICRPKFIVRHSRWYKNYMLIQFVVFLEPFSFLYNFFNLGDQ
jgi:hypothetical protein